MQVSTQAIRTPASDLAGYAYGATAAIIWGSQLVMNRAGAIHGLDGLDVAALRSGFAGLLLLPWFFARPRYGSGPGRVPWLHAIGLALAAGPLFIGASMLGFHFAPLPHGAVLQPSTMVLTAMLLSATLLHERLRARRLAGAAIILSGLTLIAGPALLQGDRMTPIGDGLFIIAGALFASYSVLSKLWSVGPMHATAAAAVIAGAIFLPPYLLFAGPAHILALSWPMLLGQIFVQAILTGIVSLLAFGRAIQILGAARASLFPALVPVSAILIGIPIVGELPTPLQLTGLLIVTAGLLVALSTRQATPVPVSSPR